MIRNLKVPLATVLALVAFGAVGASGSAAAEFHCSAEPCRVTVKADGTGTTAHQVIAIKNESSSFSTTCATITGEGTVVTKTFKEITVTNIVGTTCIVAGVTAELKMNGCDYLYKVTEAPAGTLTINCPIGKEIEAGIVGKCLYNIPPQGPLSGVKFHNVSESKNELTVEGAAKKIAITANEACGKGSTFTGEFTTANTIWTGENLESVMANLWFE